LEEIIDTVLRLEEHGVKTSHEEDPRMDNMGEAPYGVGDRMGEGPSPRSPAERETMRFMQDLEELAQNIGGAIGGGYEVVETPSNEVP